MILPDTTTGQMISVQAASIKTDAMMANLVRFKRLQAQLQEAVIVAREETAACERLIEDVLFTMEMLRDVIKNTTLVAQRAVDQAGRHGS
jgi:hypothetical protein